MMEREKRVAEHGLNERLKLVWTSQKQNTEVIKLKRGKRVAKARREKGERKVRGATDARAGGGGLRARGTQRGAAGKESSEATGATGATRAIACINTL